MTQQSQAPLATNSTAGAPAAPALSPPAAADAASDRDLQRSALRELVELTDQCAQLERQIEERFRAEADAADKDLERAQWLVEQRLNSMREGTRQKFDLSNLEAERQYEKDSTTLQNSDEAARKRIDRERQNAEQALKRDMDQAIWLAESLHEGAVNQANEDHRTAEIRYDADLDALNQLRQQGDEQVAVYRQSPPAVSPPEEKEDAPLPEDPKADLAARRAEAEQYLENLRHLRFAHIFVGAYPFIWACGLILLSLAVAQASMKTLHPHPMAVLIGLGAGGLLATILGLIAWSAARRQVAEAYLPFVLTLAAARRAAKAQLALSLRQRDRQIEHATRKRDLEVAAARDRYMPMMQAAQKRHGDASQFQKQEFARQSKRYEDQRYKAKKEIGDSFAQKSKEYDDAQARELQEAREKHDARVAENIRRHEQELAELHRKWDEGLARIQAPIADTARGTGGSIRRWDDPAWQAWLPPKEFPSAVRFGEMSVDMAQITSTPPALLKLPESFSVPALLAFPSQSSLLIHTDHAGRPEALRVLQMVMARLLTGLPPGRAHFTIIDPVGLGQSFAGFMHLADHDEALVGARIWTEREHIEQRLADLTEHMETVIQKYLRNEFATIDEYNAQAGELAEPYRFLVIADFPVGFEGDAFRRLASIASSGARCGVYTLVLRDTRTPLPPEARLEELSAHSINLVREGEKFVWKDEVFKRFPLTLDAPPPEEQLNRILEVVGREAREAKRVEVPFTAIAPAANALWSGTTRHDVQVPIGRLGATRLQMLRLGRGVAQHALIAGKTGSGKSTLLHVLITNLALWYSPDEVEFYLVDFKKGVEFKTYAAHALPHARAVAVESDREFGLSVLQRIDAELTRRGELFRKAGVQDLASYRETTGRSMPRTLLIIDEFQEFFSEDDKLAQDAGILLDRLVRQGRAFGVHVLLGSQTIGGTSGLARSTIGQMAVRIALQTSEADSQLILGDNNAAARLLTRPGEAIYNDQGGLVEGNSPFQISWLPDEQRDEWLDRVTHRATTAAAETAPQPEPIVFEGNAPADLLKNHRLRALLDAKSWPDNAAAPLAWIGDPVAIKEPTAIRFRRQSGTNALIIGQADEPALAILSACLLSLAAQHKPGSARFYLLDGSPADSPHAGVLAHIAAALPQESKNIEWRAVPETINEIAQEVQRRQAEESPDAPEIYLVIYGLQRYRMLRKSEDSFSFSMSTDEEGEKKPQPEKQFPEILRDGPAVGVHVIAWADTPATLERTFDRQSMREFDNRILFQMSASDSSNLIDSPAANKLGNNRALAYSEEQGTLEKFRPYALPPQDFLTRLSTQLRSRST